jgi:UDP-N-acetyl-2-amino-2-deoxyglucuronate dehydrogenase
MTEPTDLVRLGSLRFAIVGCGVIGKVHARAISRTAGAALTVTVDLDETAARELAEQYGAAPASALRDALLRDDVDAVAICTPSGNHAALAIQALAAGKHVVIEKPLDISIEAALRLNDAMATSDRTVTVISQHRFDPSAWVVRDAIQRQLFGAITSGLVSVAWWRSQSYYDSGDWRGTVSMDGGGALMNQAIHTLDLLVWMMGQPVEVTAYAGLLAHQGIEVEDTVVAIITFESGALAVVHGTTAAYPGLSARVQVHGTLGSAIIDDDKLAYFHVASSGDAASSPVYGAGLSSNQASQALPDQGFAAQMTGADPSALSDAHDLQYADFVDAVRTGREPQVTVASAITTLQVILAIYESARTGTRVPVGVAAKPS